MTFNINVIFILDPSKKKFTYTVEQLTSVIVLYPLYSLPPHQYRCVFRNISLEE